MAQQVKLPPTKPEAGVQFLAHGRRRELTPRGTHDDRHTIYRAISSKLKHSSAHQPLSILHSYHIRRRGLHSLGLVSQQPSVPISTFR